MTPYSKTNDRPPASSPALSGPPREAPAAHANGSALPATSVVTLAKHPAAQHALTRLRNRSTNAADYRSASQNLLLLLLIDATRSLPTRTVEFPSTGDDASGQLMAKPVVLLAVDRSGLGLAHRMIECFPELIVGSIGHDTSMGGKHLGTRLHLPNAPALGDARVVVFDPVVATGRSAIRAINLARRAGAADLTLVAFVTSTEGLESVHATAAGLPVVTAAIDAKLDGHRRPMPGIGDFSARLFDQS